MNANDLSLQEYLLTKIPNSSIQIDVLGNAEFFSELSQLAGGADSLAELNHAASEIFLIRTPEYSIEQLFEDVANYYRSAEYNVTDIARPKQNVAIFKAKREGETIPVLLVLCEGVLTVNASVINE